MLVFLLPKRSCRSYIFHTKKDFDRLVFLIIERCERWHGMQLLKEKKKAVVWVLARYILKIRRCYLNGFEDWGIVIQRDDKTLLVENISLLV